MSHTFHIPVLGLAYSIDTPLKVARFGIASTVSIVDDELIERMRKYHSEQNDLPFVAISKSSPNHRAARITAYLNLMNDLVNDQFSRLRNEPILPGSDIERYFNLLPEYSTLKQGFDLLADFEDRERRNLFENILRRKMTRGAIDVNIMAKVDAMNFDKDGKYTGDENTDALAALRGFAESDLESSVVISAGMNPKLYSYLEAFKDFFPDENGNLRKKVILKVSNYRSALIQAKFLAKKGIWVSEFRIESGLNCGGHAFATDGFLLGPILEEFKADKEKMRLELFGMYKAALEAKGYFDQAMPLQKISVQGGIGTANENKFLLTYYQLDGTGWGSPFLLVPEATNVDQDTLNKLATATSEDYYLSSVSPLGVLFNNFKKSSASALQQARVLKGRPGSPCTKKYLANNTEFTEKPICTASRQYQELKIKQLATLPLSEEEYKEQFKAVTEKTCLCEGLTATVYIQNGILKPKENSAVAICPGPNLAYFSGIYSMQEMVNHIYGKIDLLKDSARSNIFINELNLYVDYLTKELSRYQDTLNDKKAKYFEGFKAQLNNGIAYYKQLLPRMTEYSKNYLDKMLDELLATELKVSLIEIGATVQ